MLQLISDLHFVKGLDPVADGFAGATVYTDVVDMQEYDECLFVLHTGVGATGTSTLTVEACDDIVPTNTAAIPFYYRAILTGDTHGALTAATAAGVATTAGNSKIYVVGIQAQALTASGYRYVRLKAAEVVDSPVLGGILIILGSSKYHGTHNSAID